MGRPRVNRERVAWTVLLDVGHVPMFDDPRWGAQVIRESLSVPTSPGRTA